MTTNKIVKTLQFYVPVSKKINVIAFLDNIIGIFCFFSSNGQKQLDAKCLSSRNATNYIEHH